jgi:hypothetical protein
MDGDYSPNNDVVAERNKRNLVRPIPLIICLTLVLQSAVAQDNRLLFHYSRKREAIYDVGDVISFRLKNSKEKITWQITGFTDSTIVSGDRSIAPHKIGAMYVDQKSKIFFPLRYQYKYYLTAAGVGYFLIDGINSKEIDRSTLIVSGTLIGAGVLSAVLIKDYMKLKPGRKLVILR